MEAKNIITVDSFCSYYKVPRAFVQSLKEFDLIEVISKDDVECIKVTHLRIVEKMIRLHYELNINMEGLDVVNNLLHQLHDLREEVGMLKTRLRLYE